MYKTSKYLKKDRLSDVIRLLSVLATDERFSFRKSDGLDSSLNGKPKSAKEWFEIVNDHPEFFKFNQVKDTTVLIFRSCLPEENGKRAPLSIDQTQKLIDQAISLHDTEIARLQKNSFLVPIVTAVIAALATGIVSYFTIRGTDNNIKNIEEKLIEIEKKIIKNNVPIKTSFNIAKAK